jgi:hypothetical protein
MGRSSPFRIAAPLAPIGQAVSAMGSKVPHVQSDIAGSRGSPAVARTTISRVPCTKCLQLQKGAEHTYQALWTSERGHSQFDMNACRDRWLKATQAQRNTDWSAMPISSPDWENIPELFDRPSESYTVQTVPSVALAKKIGERIAHDAAMCLRKEAELEIVVSNQPIKPIKEKSAPASDESAFVSGQRPTSIREFDLASRTPFAMAFEYSGSPI